MSIDLTPAVEAAARDWFDRQQARRMDPRRRHDDGTPWRWEELTPTDQRAFLVIARPVVTAAAPLIEAAVRESIADEIRAAKREVDQSITAPGHFAGLGHAERIVRGES